MWRAEETADIIGDAVVDFTVLEGFEHGTFNSENSAEFVDLVVSQL